MKEKIKNIVGSVVSPLTLGGITLLFCLAFYNFLCLLVSNSFDSDTFNIIEVVVLFLTLIGTICLLIVSNIKLKKGLENSRVFRFYSHLCLTSGYALLYLINFIDACCYSEGAKELNNLLIVNYFFNFFILALALLFLILVMFKKHKDNFVLKIIAFSLLFISFVMDFDGAIALNSFTLVILLIGLSLDITYVTLTKDDYKKENNQINNIGENK